MANDRKYIRLYPERAVALARSTLENLSRGIEISSEDADAALDALDSLGFPPDEPLFLLRGQDKLAAKAVNYYFELVREAGLSFDSDHAVDHVNAMADWRPQKMPD